MERGRIPRELPEQLREMMEHPSRECYPYAMIACTPLLMKETVEDRKKRFFLHLVRRDVYRGAEADGVRRACL